MSATSASRPQRIVFAGTPDFAATILSRLLQAGEPVTGVLTQPDRPSGRGRKLKPSPVKQLAETRKLPVLQPASLRGADARTALAALQPDLMIVAAYGLILPPAVLSLPGLGCWNVHASLLPRWRGAAPVERAIMAGDRETGACIMQMDAGLDTGPVRLARTLPIGPDMTGGELEHALAELGSDALLQVLARPEQYPPQPQSETGISYAHKLERADSRVDFHQDAEVCARLIRALNPKLPVTVTADGVNLKLLRARALADNEDQAPGTVVRVSKQGVDVACGRGVLRIESARIVRGKATVMDAATLAHAGRDLLQPGQSLEPG